MSAGFTGQLDNNKKQFHYLVEVTLISSLDIKANTQEEADDKMEEELEWSIASPIASIKSFNVLDVKEKK